MKRSESAVQKSWRVSIDNDVVQKNHNGDVHHRRWNAGAVFNVPDPRNFMCEFTLTRSDSSKTFVAGLISADASLPDCEEAHDLRRLLKGLDPYSLAFTFPTAADALQLILQGRTLAERSLWRWDQQAVRFTVANDTVMVESGTSQQSFALRGDVVPYVCLMYGDMALQVKVVSSSRKRRRSVDSLVSKMFKDRKFTDISIHCGGSVVKAHRAVLAAASPVFERMWESGMQEAQAATLDLEETAPETLEAALSFLYTSEMPEDADISSLFIFAQKYEVRDLMDHSSEMMLEGLQETNVLTRCMAVRRHAAAGNEAAQTLWGQMFKQIYRDKELCQKALEQLLDL